MLGRDESSSVRRPARARSGVGLFTALVVVACGARTGLFPDSERDADEIDSEIIDAGWRRPDAAVSCEHGGSGKRCRGATDTTECVDTTRDPQHCGGCAIRCGVVEACANSACVPIASRAPTRASLGAAVTSAPARKSRAVRRASRSRPRRLADNPE